MVTICAECVHYRRPRPVSQLLATAVPTTHGPVAEALAKIVESEGKWLEAEAALKRGRLNTSDDTWSGRPLMSPYCALREADGVWLIPEIHNRDAACEDGETGTRVRSQCALCAHRRVGEGSARDQRREDHYVRMLEEDTLSKSQSSSSDEALLTEHRQGVAQQQALEIAWVYAGQGITMARPFYFDWCARRSTPEADSYAVCVLQNAQGDCDLFEAAPTAVSKAPQAPAGPAPAPSGAGGAEPPEVGAPAPAAQATGLPPAPPLAEAEATDLVAMVAWLLELDLDAQQRSTARGLLEQQWSSDAPLRALLTGVWRPCYLQWRTLHEDLADSLREQGERALVASLRAARTPFGDYFVAAYDQVNAPLAPGDPPLTHEVAAAFVDVLAFVDAVATGAQPQTAPPELRALWTAQLTAGWSRLPAPLRTWLCRMPVTWSELRHQWLTLPDEQRWQMVAALQAQAPGYQQIGQQVLVAASSSGPQPAPTAYGTPGGPGPGPGSVPAPGGPWGSAAPATTDDAMPAWMKADDGPSEEELLERITDAQDEAERKAAEEDPALALQTRLHNRMQRSTLISQMLQSQHEVNMHIIRNIRA